MLSNHRPFTSADVVACLEDRAFAGSRGAGALALLPFVLLVGGFSPRQERGAPSAIQPSAPAPPNLPRFRIGLGREDSQLVTTVA
ncbi:hypothetical protein GRJ2_002192100 [Grus japonensis]|uniref:Uncharacterized protein n=1 Tax=Grus japonensis TaxID=30415 RepID=A0ABC9XHV3_GRUJA